MNRRIDTSRLFLLSALFIVVAGAFISLRPAMADTVRMKNGDVYRGKIVKESFNNSLQIAMSDGSEKHLVWSDIQTIDRDEALPEPKSELKLEPKVEASPSPAVSESSVPIASVSPSPATSPTASEPVTPVAVAALEPAPQPSEPFRVELDFTSISFDNTWDQKTQNNISVNQSAHTLITSPEELTLRVLPEHWMIQGRYYSDIQAADGTTVPNQAYSDLAIAYGFNRNFYLGLWGSFNRSSINDSNGNTISQDYAFGGYMRAIAPFSPIVAFEFQAAAGPDFRVLTSNINYTGTSFAATESLFFTVRIAKQVRLLFGVEGWERIGDVNVTDTQGAPAADGYTEDTFRLRAVPIGLRVQF